MLRMLQVPELARAMGFDHNLTLDRGSRRERIMLLGNGVCPPVMEAAVTALVGKEPLKSNANSSGVGSPAPLSGDEGTDSPLPLMQVT